MNERLLAGWITAIVLVVGSMAEAQVPFLGGGVVAFDPEVSVISSGALLDVQGIVSADRKNVTLTMRPQLNRLQSLQPFPVNAIVNGGFVGGINLPAGNAVARNAPADNGRRGDAIATNTNPSPDALARTAKAWVFTRQGMYLVARLP